MLDEAKFSRELKPVNGLEITWEPPTGDTMDANIVKAEVKKNSAPTPWESYLQKRKERRKVNFIFLPNNCIHYYIQLLYCIYRSQFFFATNAFI